MILGVIEDLLDKFENGTPEEIEDSKNSLMQSKEQFKQNLQPLVDGGNADAQKILDRLNSI